MQSHSDARARVHTAVASSFKLLNIVQAKRGMPTVE